MAGPARPIPLRPLKSRALPWLVLLMSMMALLGPGKTNTLLVVGLLTAPGTSRVIRGSVLRIKQNQYIEAARARGLGERRVHWRHGWRNALFPVVTLFGLWLPLLVAGSVFVEKIFAWPGLGALAADAVASRDYPLLMGASLLVTGLVVAGSLVADVAYAALDPRVRRP